MTRPARPKRRRHRATAARQALSLYEAELLALTGDTGLLPASTGIRSGQPRVSAAAARAALRAAGVPPHIAARFRRRLRLTPEQEAER